MAQLLAILQGLESQDSLKLSDEFIKMRYDFVQWLDLNGYYAESINSDNKTYRIVKHGEKWNRRVR